VSQAKPVMMLARWNSPPRLMSLGDWAKPAPARAMVVSMVTAVPALYIPKRCRPARQDRQPLASAAAGRSAM